MKLSKDFLVPYLENYYIVNNRLISKDRWVTGEYYIEEEHDLNFHGILKFYDYDEETKVFTTYKAKFTDGELVRVEKTDDKGGNFRESNKVEVPVEFVIKRIKELPGEKRNNMENCKVTYYQKNPDFYQEYDKNYDNCMKKDKMPDKPNAPAIAMIIAVLVGIAGFIWVIGFLLHK